MADRDGAARGMTTRVRRRGDDIPPVSDYAHWNEEAESMWFLENRYDMEHADEIIEDDWYDRIDHEPEPFEDGFPTEAEARAFIAKYKIDQDSDTYLTKWRDEWIVEHYDEKAHKAWLNL